MAFICDYKKSWEALNDKKGWDASNLTQGLEKSIQENNIEDLRVFWDYFKTRHKHLKENLSENEKISFKESVKAVSELFDAAVKIDNSLSS